MPLNFPLSPAVNDVHTESGTTWVYNGTGWIRSLTTTASGGGVTVQDEGVPLATTATTLNFVGTGVVASGAGATKTVTINAGSGTGDLIAANNLSELTATASTARTNLGLGTLATQSGTFSGTSSGTNTGTNSGDNAINSNYSGLAADIALRAPIANPTFTGEPIADQWSLNNFGSGAFRAQIIHNGTLSANRILYLDMGDAPRILTFAGDATISGSNTGDQDLSTINLLQSTLLSTGLRSGGVLSINADTTKFDVSAGSGWVVDSTSYLAPTKTLVTWSAFTAQTTTNLATSELTYIGIDVGGAIVQLTTFPTAAQRRQYIFLGRLNHELLAAILFVNTFPDTNQSPMSQFTDFVDTLGPFSYQGNTITANGANLSIDKSAGKMYAKSVNFTTSNQSPSNKNLDALTLASFKYQTQDAPAVSAVTVLDPTQYDLAGVITTVGGGTSTSVQRVYIFPSNTIKVSYGQRIYSGLSDGVTNYSSEEFVPNTTTEAIGVLIAYIVIQQNCTSLQDTARCRIIRATTFGSGGGSSGGTTSLQQAYNNSGAPEILTDATNLGLTIRRGSGADTDVVLETQNAAASTTFSVTGAGVVTGVLTNATGLPLSTGVTGTLPVANGGTGLTALGTASQVLRTNAGATALEFFTPSGGGNAQTADPLSQFAQTTSLQLKNTISDETGSGLLVFATDPVMTLTNATGLPIATGVSGLGTGIATALAINTGSAGAPVLLGGAGGTPSALTLTNATGLPTAGMVDAAVTLAKMANLAQDQFIGRTTASTGVPETATITAAARTVLDDTTVGAMRQTLQVNLISEFHFFSSF